MNFWWSNWSANCSTFLNYNLTEAFIIVPLEFFIAYTIYNSHFEVIWSILGHMSDGIIQIPKFKLFRFNRKKVWIQPINYPTIWYSLYPLLINWSLDRVYSTYYTVFRICLYCLLNSWTPTIFTVFPLIHALQSLSAKHVDQTVKNQRYDSKYFFKFRKTKYSHGWTIALLEILFIGIFTITFKGS